jgi:hypothetical protein
LDYKQTARNNVQLDRAIEAASRTIDGLMHRVFYPTDTTHFWDWPSFQYAYPWRIWFDEAELADVTVNVPVATSGGHVINNANIFWGHPQYTPPFTYMELNRSSSESFGRGNTPQRDVAITGTYGFGIDTRPGGTLAVALTDTTGTAATVTNGAAIGVGDLLLIGTERLLVTERANVTSGQTQQGAGVGTVLTSDNILAVTDGTKFFVNEVVTLDGERMLVVDVTGNNLTVKRAWDGTVLSAHTGSTVFVSRLLTVTRGAQGTVAATHLIASTVNVHAVPSLIRQLAVGEATVELAMEQGAYATVQGSGPSKKGNIGMGLDRLREQAFTLYGRKARKRTV